VTTTTRRGLAAVLAMAIFACLGLVWPAWHSLQISARAVGERQTQAALICLVLALIFRWLCTFLCTTLYPELYGPLILPQLRRLTMQRKHAAT
jgi:hypothetical protein